MLIVISPAKLLDFETKPVTKKHTLPELLNESEKLADKLKEMNAKELSELMKISPELGIVNYNRFQMWHPHFTFKNAKQAVLSFNGNVYAGINATAMTEKQLLEAQQKLRILSGLYGVLKPLDLIQPYRLEMGTKLSIGKTKTLYGFWGDKITKKIQEAIDESGSDILVNLASNEYFKSINLKKLNAEVVTPAFKDMKNGEYKMISFFAKKARGLMTRFIIENDIKKVTDLQAFDSEGYIFNPRLSKPGEPVFTRG